MKSGVKSAPLRKYLDITTSVQSSLFWSVRIRGQIESSVALRPCNIHLTFPSPFFSSMHCFVSFSRCTIHRNVIGHQRALFRTSTRMSSGPGSAALYAVVSSSSQATGVIPSDAKELRHHAKDGKGFINPWDSYEDKSAFQMVKAILL